MPTQPYLRKVEVLVGPLPEWKGGGDQKLAVKFAGNGTNEQLRVKFDVRLAIPWTANPTIVTIYNLSKELRSALHKAGGEGTKLEIQVGWENQPMTTIFMGSMMAAYHQRQGADITTQLLSLAGYSAISRTAIADTFVPSTPISQIVHSLATQIPGITVDQANIKVGSLQVGSQGLTQSGSVKECLDSLSRTYGFSWSIDKGIFYALSDNDALGADVLEMSPTSAPGYLLRAEPVLKPPSQIMDAVNMTCTLNPFVQLGKTIDLKSTVNPQINGKYKVHTITHTGDTHSSDWQTMVESQLYGGYNGTAAQSIGFTGASNPQGG